MSKLLSPGRSRIAIQICVVSAVAALMSGCSSDTTRFGDAFGNPFSTGSIEKPKHVAVRRPPTGTGKEAPVVATALPPRGTAVAGAAPVRAAPVVASRDTTGSITPAREVAGASFGGWSREGGASVEIAQGDTAATLAQRYGVPEKVLLEVNGFRSASDLQPGGRIVVPVYNAVASVPGAAPRLAQGASRTEPVEAPREPAARAAPAHVAKAAVPPVREARAEPGRKAAAPPFKLASAEPPPRIDRAGDAKTAGERALATRKAAAAERDARAKAARAAKPEDADQAEVPAGDAARPRLAKGDPSKPAKAPTPKVATTAPAKPEQAPMAAPEKPVDNMTTASVAPGGGEAPAADAGGPEFRWPARGRIIAGFKGGAGGNDGINIAVPDGTPVKAAEGGVVAYAGNELKGYGNLVLIKHPNGYVTAYANNGEIDVKRGETVKRGQLIAKSGQSGNVSSPQLHFELRKGSQPVDPTHFLAGL